jgi:hypothetical protein
MLKLKLKAYYSRILFGIMLRASHLHLHGIAEPHTAPKAVHGESPSLRDIQIHPPVVPKLTHSHCAGNERRQRYGLLINHPSQSLPLITGLLLT